MWVVFENLEHRKGVKAKSGNLYDAWFMTGIKRGYEEAPDEPYEKAFFDNSTTTVIEKGIKRPGQSIVQFLQKACKKGDLIELKNEKQGRNWEIVSIENKSVAVPTYEPLTDEQVAALSAEPMEAPALPTMPDAPESSEPPFEMD